MKAVALACLLLTGACSSNTPNLPGQFIGSFLFNGSLIQSDGGPTTTCLVDGGALYLPTTVQFYAEISLLPDSGVLWQLPNASPDLGAEISGGQDGEGLLVVTRTQALVSGCGCTASYVETVRLTAGDDGGLAPGLSSLTGVLDDRLDPDRTQAPVCVSDAGPGCGLGCDLFYAITGTPGRP